MPAILDKLNTLGTDAIPTFFIKFIFMNKFLITLYSCFRVRNQTINQLIFPPIYNTGHKRIYDSVRNTIPLRQDSHFIRVFFHNFYIFPYRGRRFPEYCIPLFLRIIFEHILLAAVLSFFLQIIGIFSGSFRKLL